MGRNPPQTGISRLRLSVEIQHVLQILQALRVSGLERHAQPMELRRLKATGSRF
jgi:hypothetical protein